MNLNKTQQNPANTSANSFSMLRAMVAIGILCALMIVLTYEGTFGRIEQLKAEALEKAIFRVIPGIVKSSAFQLDPDGNFVEASEENTTPMIYAGYDENDRLVGVAVEASGQGYADILRILYGYDKKYQKIIGFYVLESKETPGLGDKIEKDPNFLANFEALDLSLNDDRSAVKNRVIPVKKGAKENAWEVEGITGATISSRAIGNIIGESTDYWVPVIYKNKEKLMLNSEE